MSIPSPALILKYLVHPDSAPAEEGTPMVMDCFGYLRFPPEYPVRALDAGRAV